MNRVVSQWRDKTIVGGCGSVSVDSTEKHVELSYEKSTTPGSGSIHPLDLHSVDAKDAITGEILPLHIAGKLPLPWQSENSFSVSVNGQMLNVDRQIQLYCPNSLLIHPLISPVLSYLGGLAPLFIVAGEKEVLRDEIIYLRVLRPHVRCTTNFVIVPIRLHIPTNISFMKIQRNSIPKFKTPS